MKIPEQLCPHDRGAFRRWYKRVANRIMRRAARRDPENAPRRHRYRGYST